MGHFASAHWVSRLKIGQSRLFREPTIEVLQRLSDGSGIAVDVLEQMTLARIWARQMEELRQSIETTYVKLE